MGRLFCLSFFSRKSKVAKAMQCAEMTQNQVLPGKRDNTINLPECFADSKLLVGSLVNGLSSDQSLDSVENEKGVFQANGMLSYANTDIDESGDTENCISDGTQSRKKDDATNLADLSSVHLKISVGKEFSHRVDAKKGSSIEKLPTADGSVDNANAQISRGEKTIVESFLVTDRPVDITESFLLVEKSVDNETVDHHTCFLQGEKLGSDSFDNYSDESDSESLEVNSTRQASQVSLRPLGVEAMSPIIDFYDTGKQRVFEKRYEEDMFTDDASPNKPPLFISDRTECGDDLQAGHLSDPGIYRREEMQSLNGSPILHRNGSGMEGSISSQNHESHSFMSKSVASADMTDNLSVRTSERHLESRNERMGMHEIPTEIRGRVIQDEQASQGKACGWWQLANANSGSAADEGLNLSGIQMKPIDNDLSYNKNLNRVEEWINTIEEPVYEEMVIATEEVGESSNSQPNPATASCEVANSVLRTLHAFSTTAHLSSIGLREVPPIGLFNCLKTLNLSGNFISRVPAGSLPQSLHVLDLSNNRIPQIEGLRELTRLRILNLSYNKVSKIGHGLANCTRIKELYLAGNKIAEVEGLHRLLKLSVLDLSDNKIATSKGLGQLAANYSSLLALNLVGNPILANIGEEQVRKLVTSLTPHVTYLNKHAIKAISVREAVIDSVARAALGTHRNSKSNNKGGSIRSSRTSAQSKSQKKLVSNRINKDSEKRSKSRHHHRQHDDNGGMSSRHHGDRNLAKESVTLNSSFVFDTSIHPMHRSRSESALQGE